MKTRDTVGEIRRPMSLPSIILATLLATSTAGWAWPDLVLVKRGPAEVSPGDLVTYTLDYGNDKPSSRQRARDVVLSDALPAEVDYVPGSASGSATLNGNVLEWELGDLSVGSAGSQTYQVRVKTNTPYGQQFSNHAEITSSNEDEAPGDNLSVVTTVVRFPVPPVAVNDSYSTIEDVPLSIPSPGVLANDMDLDGDALTAALLSQTTNGLLVFNPDGSFSYRPDPGFVGTDAFTYAALDGTTNSGAATVTIVVEPCYPYVDVMVVLDRSGSMKGDPYQHATQAASSLVHNLKLGLDGDQAGLVSYNSAATLDQVLTTNAATLEAAIDSIPSAGGYTSISLGLQTAQTELDSGRHNPDALPVIILLSDGMPTASDNPAAVRAAASAAKSSGSRIFTVGLGDVDHVLMADVASSPGDYYHTTNSSDLTSLFNAISAVICRPPTNIIAAGPEDMSVCPGSPAAFSVVASGCDVFAYQWMKDALILVGETNSTLNLASVAADDAGVYAVSVSSVCQTVTNAAVLTVLEPVNATPLQDQWAPVGGNAQFSTRAVGAGELGYTWRQNGAVLAGETNAVLVLGGLTQADAGSYSVEITGTCGSVIVSASLTILNTAPVAEAQGVTTPEDTPQAIVLSGSDLDGDQISYGLVGWPTNGSLSGFDALTGDVIYTPATNYVGGDSFTFLVNDGQVDSAVATVSITVTPVNDPPMAEDQSVSTAEDTARAIELSGSDLDGDQISYGLVGWPTNGSLSGFDALTGDVIYTPATNYVGGDSFTFLVNDGQVDSAVATVSITVTPVNDPPVTPRMGSEYTVVEDGLLEIEAPGLLSGILDADGDVLGIIPVSGTTNGTVQVSTNGAFIYQPAADFFGSDRFQFRITDGTAISVVLSAAIRVLPVNDPPSFVKGASQFHQLDAPKQTIPGWATAISPGPPNESEQTVMFQVSSDNPSLFSQQPQIAPDGTLEYAPAAGEFGIAVVTVVVRDNGGDANGGEDTSELQTFTVTVNSPPVVSIISPEDEMEFLIPINFTVAADAVDADGTVTRLDLFQSTNLVATFTNAGPYFDVLTNVAPGTYEFSAYAEDDRGASAWSETVTVTVFDSPPVTAITPVTFNPQTGLFEQQVRVDNPSYYPLAGVKVLVDELPEGAALFNGTGFIEGVPFILSRFSIPAGGSVVLTLEYYLTTPDYPDPLLSAELDATPQPVVQLAGVQQTVDRGFALADGTFMLEFATEDGRAYVVEFSSDLSEWNSATPVLVGNGGKRQWIDSGQPKTDSLPGNEPMRFYRLIMLP